MNNEFSRQFVPIIFENASNQVIDVYLRLSDAIGDRWDNNANNTMRFESVKTLLASNTHECYFQKMKSEPTNSKSNHSIFIRLNEDRAINLKVSLWTINMDFTSKYSYMVHKAKETPFIKYPEDEVYIAECRFHFLTYNEQSGSTAIDFQQLYQKIESLNIPTVELNKEKDKKIWNSYVTALKKLIREKEEVWKIKRIGKPYQEDYVNGERPTYLDISINEKELRNAFCKSLEELFRGELDDLGANDETAFIEFASFRELSQTERERVETLASEYFFELEPQPIHSLSGEIYFDHINEENIKDTYEQIRQYLVNEYEIPITIGTDGKISCNKDELNIASKVIEKQYGKSLTIQKDSSIRLKVHFKQPQEKKIIDIAAVRNVLLDLGLSLDKIKISATEDLHKIAIEVNSFLRFDAFKSIGLKHVKNVFKFGSRKRKAEKEISGLYIDNGLYCAEGIRIEEAKELQRKIQEELSDDSFRMLPTMYVYELPSEPIPISVLREFKANIDSEQCTFDIKTEELTVNADSEEEYLEILENCQNAENVIIEQALYNPTYYIKLRSNLMDERKETIQNIQNELRKLDYNNVSYDYIKEYSRTIINYNYDSEEERDSFIDAIQKICETTDAHVSLRFDNIKGSTTYEFAKNEELETKREKEVYNNIRQASFIYLSRNEYEAYRTLVQKLGDDANFRGGIQIGTLIKKDHEKFKFRLRPEFEDLLERVETGDLSDGYIKPIFPGELTNISRMIRAMKKVSDPDSAGYPANANLSNFIFDPNTARLPQEDIELEKKRILSNLNEPLLGRQPKQLDAVAKALIAPDIAIIQGPPGTGKTTVIAEIIWQTLLKNPAAKILITSQTNLAVDNALERLKGKKLVRPIRIGNIEKFEDEGKLYSDKRIKEWLSSRTDSIEERSSMDNAVFHWINTIISKTIEDEQYQEAVTLWKKGLSSKTPLIKTIFSTEYLKQVNVFAATCSECGSKNFSDIYQSIFLKDKEIQGDPVFDLVIMDEASKATPPELILPLTLGQKVIIIGDHKQLPPMIDEKEFTEALEAVGAKKLIEDWTQTDYKTSQFEKLFVNAPRKVVSSLDTQFRMHEQIMNCIKQFYQDQEELEHGLICGIKDQMDIPDFTNKSSRWHGLQMIPFITPETHAIWVNVDTPEEKIGTSYQNLGEIEAIKLVLKALTHSDGFQEYFSHCKKEEDKEIGVITYYMPQMLSIRRALYPEFGKKEWITFEQHKYENEYQLPFRINTVDRFQGMERNIIIVSTVRSNKQKVSEDKIIKNEKYPYALGFARELQRVNVGFSRAKRLLIVIGNEKHFSNKVEYAEAIQKMHKIDVKQLRNL